MSGSYEIRVRGRLGPEMVHLLADLTPEPAGRSTSLHTSGLDQPTLHGALARIWSLGLSVESVQRRARPGE